MIPLRDRIADLLAHHPAFNLKDDGYSAEDVLRMADAVIRELGLYEERTASETVTNEQGATFYRQGGYRYVTEWTVHE